MCPSLSFPKVSLLFTPKEGRGCLELVCLLANNYRYAVWVAALENFLDQRWENIFFERPDNKYFKLCKLHSLCCNFPALLSWHRSNHRQYINEWAWLCANKTSLWNLKTEFHVVIVCHNIMFFFCFFFFIFKHLKMWKLFFIYRPHPHK